MARVCEVKREGSTLAGQCRRWERRLGASMHGGCSSGARQSVRTRVAGIVAEGSTGRIS